MNLSRLLILFSFFTLLTLLLSSTTSAALCDDLSPPSDKPRKQFVVILKPKNLIGIVLTLVQHLLELVLCLGRRIVKFKPGEGLFGNGPLDLDLITDLSVDGLNAIYTGFFDEDDIDFLSRKPEVDIIEEIIPASVIDIPTIIEERKRATQTGAPFNLDRIDQKDFPLNNNFNFPTNAGNGVNVFVVDTGIDIQNVEFEGRASHGGSFCNGCPSTDDHGHGTNVAGIIGGKKFGVSKKVKLIAVKVLNQNGQGDSSTVIAGISFIISKHKSSSNKNTIINLSLAGAFSSALNKVVNDAFKAGIHIVASAGDTASNACNFSPASAPQAITVGATEKSTNTVASFSNTGSCVDIYAPGRDIIAAGADLVNSLSKSSGTSQACPHVAGTIALIISKQGNASPSTMTNTLINLSTKNILLNADPNRFLLVPSP